MTTLGLIEGSGIATEGEDREHPALTSVQQARQLGFVIGREVRLGSVSGTIIGYNIAGDGAFSGDAFPLLVKTSYGPVKCSLGEVQLVGAP